MRCRFPIAVAAGLAAAALAAPASAGVPEPPDEIHVGDDFFDPENYSGTPGTDVAWERDSGAFGEHNAVQDRKLFDSGELTEDIDYTVTPSAGTFPYYCVEHGEEGGFGMAGKLRIPPRMTTSRRRGDVVFGVQWANGSDTGDQYDVRYKGPGTKGTYKSWLKNTTDEEALFGDGEEPVRVKPGKTYTLQARSESSSSPNRKSKWSPKLVLEAAP